MSECMENKERFDYDAAIAELEKIVSTLENPDTPIDRKSVV